MKNFRDDMCLVPEKDILNVLVKDAQVLCSSSNSRDAFVESNKAEYFIAVNTWILMIKTYSNYGWIYMKDRIMKDGLAATVRWCNEFATQYVANPDQGHTSEYQLLWTIRQDIHEMYSDRNFYHAADLPRESEVQVFLSILRYLKRLSPSYATALNDKAIDDFVLTQKRLKLRDRGTGQKDNQLILDLVKAEVDYLDIDSRIERFAQMSVWDVEFTSGSAYDSLPMLISKLQATKKVCPEFFQNLEHHVSAFHPIIMGRTLDHVKVQAVPKNIKTARTIAMENTYRQAVAKRMFTIWQDSLPAAIDLHDQSRNQRLAQQGSIDGSLATIDLHAASDSVRYSLVKWIYPIQFTEYLDLVRPRIADIERNRSISLTSWATMGNSLTFILESEIFYLIIMAAARFHERHFGLTSELVVSVYGDDLVVSTEVAPTVICFLEALGFEVNGDKTFLEGSYRESCGKEYSGGKDWSSIYFPRFPIMDDLRHSVRDSRTDTWQTDFSRLIELQHRLYSVSHEASHWLGVFLLSRKPRIAVCLPGSDGSENAVWGLDTRYSAQRVLKRFVYIEWRQWELYHYIPIFGIMELPESVDDVEPTLLEARTRRYVCVPVREFDTISSELLEQYLYLKFLKEGPRFQDALSRLLGVSEPTLRVDPLNGEYRWKDIEI